MEWLGGRTFGEVSWFSLVVYPPHLLVALSSSTMAALRYAPALRRLAASQLSRLPLQRGLASLKQPASLFAPLDTFQERHIGPDDAEASKMLSQLGYDSIDAFIADTVPPKIRVPPNVVDNTSIPVYSESQLYDRAKELGAQNKSFKSYIGMGYHNAVVPPVILRNVCLKLFSLLLCASSS